MYENFAASTPATPLSAATDEEWMPSTIVPGDFLDETCRRRYLREHWGDDGTQTDQDGTILSKGSILHLKFFVFVNHTSITIGQYRIYARYHYVQLLTL
jgi:hypothetical protein